MPRDVPLSSFLFVFWVAQRRSPCPRSPLSFGLPRDVLYNFASPTRCSFSNNASIFGLSRLLIACSPFQQQLYAPSSNRLFLSSPPSFGLPRVILHALPAVLFLTAPPSLIFASVFGQALLILASVFWAAQSHPSRPPRCSFSNSASFPHLRLRLQTGSSYSRFRAHLSCSCACSCAPSLCFHVRLFGFPDASFLCAHLSNSTSMFPADSLFVSSPPSFGLPRDVSSSPLDQAVALFPTAPVGTLPSHLRLCLLGCPETVKHSD